MLFKRKCRKFQDTVEFQVRMCYTVRPAKDGECFHNCSPIYFWGIGP